ncbi:MAG: RibD family protein [Gammaproteobacteria bacterium]
MLQSVYASETDPVRHRLQAVCGDLPQQLTLDLYESFARADARYPSVVAHLGQSIDGFIATGRGDSYYVTGPENLDHLHRMRALADAVVVGAGTIKADDPALTTRRVSGPNPLRVILDGRRRLDHSYGVFTDGAAPTLLVCGDDCASPRRHGAAEVLALPLVGGNISIVALVEALGARGAHRVFVEGGGNVVSAFLASGVLHRLQLSIAPVLIGNGRRGVTAPAQARLRDCLRPPHRLYSMGEDLLFDYDLRATAAGAFATQSKFARLR